MAGRDEMVTKQARNTRFVDALLCVSRERENHTYSTNPSSSLTRQKDLGSSVLDVHTNQRTFRGRT